MNILIVDDVPANLQLLSEELKAGGHTVVSAGNGTEGLRALEREKVDAIISDIMMPGMDGYHFCQEVRRDERFALIPFIFYSAAYTSPSDENLSLSIGADKFLTRSTSAEVILDTLAEVAAGEKYKRARTITAPASIDVMKEYSERLVSKLEQKNTELAQRNEQLALQGAALETTANGVVITDPKGIIEWVNPAFTTLTGYTAGEAVGKPIRILKSGKQSRAFYKSLWDTILAGSTWRGGFVNRRKDGSLYHDEHTITPVKSREGGIQHFVTIMNDVTEQRRAEEALRESEKKFHTLFDAANDGIFIVKEGVFIQINARGMELIGWPPEEIIGFGPDKFSPPLQPDGRNSREKAMELIQAALAGTPQFFEWTINRKDGATIDAEISVSRFEMGGQWCLQAIVRDVTERKHAEESLTLFRELIDRSNDAIEVIDPDTGRFLDFNELACTRLGYTREEMLAMSVPDVEVSSVTRANLPGLLAEIKKEGFRIIEGRHRKKNGSTFPIEVSARFIHLKRDYIVAVIRDITERTNAEAALRESEERFRQMAENIQEVFWLVDPVKNEMLYVSPAYERTWGRRCADLYASPGTWMDAIHPEDRKRIQDAWLSSRGEGYNVEYRVVRPDGSVSWIHDQAFPVRGASGETHRIAGVAQDITGRKQVEERERWQQAQLSSAVRIAELGSWDYDISRDRLEWSQETFRIFGVRPEEFGGTMADFQALVHPDDLEKMREVHSGSLTTGASIEFEYRIRRPDGGWRILYDRGETICNETGKPIRRIGVVMDITERKQAHDALRESEHRFREMMENLELIAIMLDTEGRLTFCNDYLLRITGWKREDVIGADWCVKFLLEEDTDTRKIFLEKIDSGMLPAHRENPIKTRSGKQRQIVWNNTMLRDREGNVIGVASVGEDVTESRLALERIAEQAALIDQTRDAIMVRGLDGRILFWSKGAERIYGYTAPEVLGKKAAELLYTPASMAKYGEAYAATLAHGTWSGELQQFVKDGRKVTEEASWTLMRDEAGNPKSILVINTDITERKKIEAQFLRAQRMESIGTLASGVAHDLNNILSPILMSIEILKDLPDGGQRMRILETIEASAQRGAEIVQQVLSFGRGMEGARVEVQAKHLLKDVVRIVRDTFPKDIRFNATVAPDTWTVLGDPTQLYQVLLNLCVNARDAMPHGGTLSIEMKNVTLDEHYATANLKSATGPHVLIEVTDSGTGIPQDLIEKIFDPFFTTKEEGKGTGLGLSTVMAIVKGHDGFVNVYSEPGKGTIFRLYLPALTTQAAAKLEDETAGLPRGEGEIVLLIDDETSILTITRQTLEAFGYQVLTADNGAAAVGIYAQHKNEIAVVLTDMMMPLMDGVATIQALKTINPEVRIIAASGLNTSSHAARAAGSEVRHFLPKPYNARTLLEMIRRVLDEGKTR